MTQSPPPIPFPTFDSQTRLDGFGIIFTTVSLLGQTLLYGVFVAITPSAIRIVTRQFQNRRIAKVAFPLHIFTLVLSTVYWAICIATLFEKMNTYLVNQVRASERPHYINQIKDVSNAVILLNVVLSDSVVLWRAKRICRNFRIALMVSTFFLLLTIMSVFATIGIRIFASSVETVSGFEKQTDKIRKAISISQLAYQLFSLLNNITATGAIGWKMKYYRDSLRVFGDKDMDPNATITNIFALLIESGALYCSCTAALFISQFIQLPAGTVGDIIGPIYAQMAGMYPSAILVLVYSQESLHSVIKSPKDTISSEPQRGSGTQPDSLPKSEILDLTHISGSIISPSRTNFLENGIDSRQRASQ